ncbi:MAG: Fmu (Sun) domain-containing protein, partial [Chitinophagaceae bacterium]
MSRWYSYLRSAEDVVYKYDGEVPLAPWIKDYFRLHKQMGSTDRKIISSLVYQYYRTSRAFSKLSFNDHLYAARFLCVNRQDAFLAALSPELQADIECPLAEKEAKLLSLHQEKISFDYFPFGEALSSGIDPALYSTSFLIQPELFLRIRPGHEETVSSKLSNAGIAYSLIGGGCIAVANQSQIDTVLALNREVLIQDFNSQRVGEFFGLPSTGEPIKVWDCCAASGGKSIMAYDLDQSIDLTVSDIRESILVNLQKRFSEAGIAGYKSFKADLTHPLKLPSAAYDLVIADLPCSGSGTWSRTPEQLRYFKESRIKDYSDLQKEILSRIVGTLRPGARLVYITCS